jgi:hypothetical protein
MASQTLDKTKITKALKWARDQEILIEDDYYDAYSALRDFFDNLDLTNEPNVVGAAHAVYGWMPTILKKEVKAKELIAFVQDLRRISSDSHQTTVALELLEKQIEITQAINDSTVGTSKFLHFVAPEIFPIWDSNIAHAFEVASKINDPATYLAYCEAIHLFLDEKIEINWPNKLPNGISNVRKIEFCLYAHGKFLKTRQ